MPNLLYKTFTKKQRKPSGKNDSFLVYNQLAQASFQVDTIWFLNILLKNRKFSIKARIALQEF